MNRWHSPLPQDHPGAANFGHHMRDGGNVVAITARKSRA
jgi:hypothetical protein